MPETPPILETAGAICIDDQKILLVRRPADKKVFGGYWTFPGGKMEAGETPETCMLREFAEETGGKVVTSKPYLVSEYTHTYNHVISHLFVVEAEDVAENADVRWFALQDAVAMELAFEYQRLLRDITLQL